MQFIDSKLLMSEQDVEQAIRYFLNSKVFISSKIEMTVDAPPAIITLAVPTESVSTNQIEGESK